MNRLWLIPLMLTARAGADELTIASGAQSEYVIVCADSALPATRFAAEELQHFIMRSTGATLRIAPTREESRPAIVLESDTSLAMEGFRIHVDGADLVIAGHDSDGDPARIDYEAPTSCGTLSGVYELLERFLGVRFYWPDDLGTIVPTHSKLVIPGELDLRDKPHMTLRRLWHGPGWKNVLEEAASGLWGRRLRLGASKPTKYNHAWHRIANVEEWARRGHPEYAALVNGRRRTEFERKAPFKGGQLCISNPEILPLFVEAARASKGAMFSVSPNDGYGAMCECERCRALDSGRRIPDGRQKGERDLSDRIIGFYNTVAERANRRVGGYAYNEYIEVPAHTKLHPNVSISVALNNAWLAGNDVERGRAERIYRAWGAFAENVTAYDIMFWNKENMMKDLIAPLGDDAVRRVRLIADAGLVGALLYIAPEMELGGPDAYLAARLMWAPHADADRIREGYFRDLYGRAGKSVARLYDHAAEQWRKAAGAHRFGKRFRAQLNVVPVLEQDLADAEAKAGPDPHVRARLARLRRAVQRMADHRRP